MKRKIEIDRERKRGTKAKGLSEEQAGQLEEEKVLEGKDDLIKDGVGRKTVITPFVLIQLEKAFSLGATDVEACQFAGIGKSTLYDYQQKNPLFVERKEELKSKTILLARQTLIKGITGYSERLPDGSTRHASPNPELALKYLKNKKADEFQEQQSFTIREAERVNSYKQALLKLIPISKEKKDDQ